MQRGIHKKTGENSPFWKGENAGYDAKHSYMAKTYGKPQLCEECKTTEAPKGKRAAYWFHWANISGKYLRERSDWKRLCKMCHMKMDYDSRAKGERMAAPKPISSCLHDNCSCPPNSPHIHMLSCPCPKCSPQF